MFEISRPLTDIHAHVLPNVDDGPATVAESLALTELYCSEGIARVFCTPHYRSPAYHVPAAAALSAFGTLEEQRQQRGAESNAAPQLVVGAEVHLALDLAEDLRQDSVPTLGSTRYVLVEIPNNDLPAHSLRWIHELIVRGYRPIMAHPERNTVLRKDSKQLDHLIEMGLLMQLTAMCFIPDEARDAARITEAGLGNTADPNRHLIQRTDARHQVHDFAWRILSRGYGTVIASDAHSTTRRPPWLARAYESIGDRLGAQVTDTLIDNANAIWGDEDVQRVSPPAIQHKRTWFGLRRDK